jgi:peptidoglycan hydrolase-like protein with peptidoglycan-binding domain
MSTQLLRQYIDLLNEQETTVKVPSRQETERRARELAVKMGVAAPNLIDIEAQGGVAVKINGDTVPANLYTPQEKQLIATARLLSGGAAAAPAQRDEPAASTAPSASPSSTAPASPSTAPSASPSASPSANPSASSGSTEDRVKALQKELKAKGADLGNYGPAGDGIDGDLGPKTRAAAAKFPEIAAKYKDVLGGGSAASPAAGASSGDTPPDQVTAKLVNALGALEAVLSKYNIKTNESLDPIDALVLENINQYSATEQIEIWTLLAEDDEKPRLPPGAKFDRSTGNWYVENPGGGRTVLGGTATTTPAQSFMPTKKPSRLAKFFRKLGGGRGVAKKVATRAAGALATGPAAAVVGAGALAWTAWDIGKALYDAFTETELEDLDEQDQEIIKKNLAVIMQYQKDPKMIEKLTPELKVRLERVMKGLNALAVKLD